MSSRSTRACWLVKLPEEGRPIEAHKKASAKMYPIKNESQRFSFEFRKVRKFLARTKAESPAEAFKGMDCWGVPVFLGFGTGLVVLWIPGILDVTHEWIQYYLFLIAALSPDASVRWLKTPACHRCECCRCSNGWSCQAGRHDVQTSAVSLEAGGQPRGGGSASRREAQQRRGAAKSDTSMDLARTFQREDWNKIE